LYTSLSRMIHPAKLAGVLRTANCPRQTGGG